MVETIGHPSDWRTPSARTIILVAIAVAVVTGVMTPACRERFPSDMARLWGRAVTAYAAFIR